MAFSEMRDLSEKPYSDDEKRVAKWMCDKIGVGGGDDPIGFVICSHEYLAYSRNKIRDVLRRFHAYASDRIEDAEEHDNPIWAEVKEAFD